MQRMAKAETRRELGERVSIRCSLQLAEMPNDCPRPIDPPGYFECYACVCNAAKWVDGPSCPPELPTLSSLRRDASETQPTYNPSEGICDQVGERIASLTDERTGVSLHLERSANNVAAMGNLRQSSDNCVDESGSQARRSAPQAARKSTFGANLC